MSKSPRRKYLFRKLLVILGRNNEKQKHYEYEKTTFDYAGDGCTATQRAEC